MNSNEDWTLLLHTALNTEQYKPIRRSPVSTGEIRIEEYRSGLQNLLSNFPKARDAKVIIIDNTVKNVSDLQVLELGRFFTSPLLIASNSNRFGRFNKGAGLVETLRYCVENHFITTDYLFFFEPRLQLVNSGFIEMFQLCPQTIFCQESSSTRLITGYFGISVREAKNLVKKISPLRLVTTNRSLEDELYQLARKLGWRIIDKSGYCIRIDPINGRIAY